MSSWTVSRSRAWTICRTWSTARGQPGCRCGWRSPVIPGALPPAVELAAYRVVQESLTNALRYARSAPASVALGYRDDGLDLTVENDAPTAGRAASGSGPSGRNARPAGPGRARSAAGRKPAGGSPARRGILGARLAAGAPVTIRVLIADDQALVRAGIRMLVETQPDIEVVGEAEDGIAAVSEVTRLCRRRAHGRPDAPDGRPRGSQADRRARPGRGQGGDAHHLRRRRVRLRRAQLRRHWLPAEARASGRAPVRHQGRGRRSRPSRAGAHAPADRAVRAQPSPRRAGAQPARPNGNARC